MKSLFIQSKDRSSNSRGASNFNISLFGVGLTDHDMYRIDTISIPNSWNDIKEQTFTMTEAALPYGPIVFPAGSYTTSEFCSTLAGLMTAAAPDTYLCTFNKVNQTFELSNTGGTLFSIDFTNNFKDRRNLGILSGFIENSALTYAIPSAGELTVIAGSFPANLSVYQNLYVKIAQFTTDSYFLSKKSPVVAIVPITSNRGEQIIWQNSTNIWFFMNPMQDNMSIRLEDDFGELVDLRSKDWSIALQIK